MLPMYVAASKCFFTLMPVLLICIKTGNSKFPNFDTFFSEIPHVVCHCELLKRRKVTEKIKNLKDFFVRHYPQLRRVTSDEIFCYPQLRRVRFSTFFLMFSPFLAKTRVSGEYIYIRYGKEIGTFGFKRIFLEAINTLKHRYNLY